MNEKAYICPICGKRVNGIAALKSCIQIDEEKAKKIEEDKKKEELLKSIRKDYDALRKKIEIANSTYGTAFDLVLSEKAVKPKPKFASSPESVPKLKTQSEETDEDGRGVDLTPWIMLLGELF